MEHGPDISQSDAYSRPTPLTEFCPASNQQTFYIRPRNVSTDGLLKNGLQSLTMF